jgi:nucleoid DNA-binding protein
MEVIKMGSQLKAQDKIKNTYTKDMLVRKIAEDCKKDTNSVRTIYNALEKIIAKLLSSANSNTDVSIRLFEGISIDSTFVPEKTKINNLTGEIITSTSKIKPKANITRNYRDKLTAYNK